jgi:hypothetical protein
MRGIRAVILLAVAAALVLTPLAAAAGRIGQGGVASAPGATMAAPQDAKAKAQIESSLAASTVAPSGAQAQGGAASAPSATMAAPQPAPAKKPAKKAPEKRTETIVPAFSGIKEQTAVYVFYGWLWLSIVVLIYFVRLWVKESDRVYHAKYYEPVESPRKDNPLPRVIGD